MSEMILLSLFIQIMVESVNCVFHLTVSHLFNIRIIFPYDKYAMSFILMSMFFFYKGYNQFPLLATLYSARLL